MRPHQLDYLTRLKSHKREWLLQASENGNRKNSNDWHFLRYCLCFHWIVVTKAESRTPIGRDPETATLVPGGERCTLTRQLTSSGLERELNGGAHGNAVWERYNLLPP